MEQLRVGRQVMQQGQGGEYLGHLRQPQQAVQADDLDRDLRRGQRVEDIGRVRVVPDEHADLAPRRRRHRRVRVRHLGGQPRELPGIRLVDDGLHIAHLVRPCLQRLHLRERRVERGRQPVGHLEDPPVGSPVDRQREAADLSTAGQREVVAEMQDVGDRRATPAVDRLVGVADGGDRMAAGEESAKHHRLANGRVLVFVEQNDPVLLPLEVTDDRVGVREPGGQGDLVGEVHQPQRRLELAVLVHEVERLRPAGERTLDLLS